MDGIQATPSFYVGTPPCYAQHSSGLVDPALGFRSEDSMLHSSNPGSAFQIDNLNSSYQHSANIGSSSGLGQGEPVKKRRGRPRKYGSDNSMALVLNPICEQPSQGFSEKQKRGRPPGSGRKQKLASIGGWMNSSAGSALAPVAIMIPAGENVAARILQLACQRPRALCIMSGSGYISSVTICQPALSDGVVKREGHFDIVCLSGSYLVSEGGPNKRTGGLNVSLSSREGDPFGGVVGNTLIADSIVQVIGFSFIYDCSKDEKPARPLKYEQEDSEPSIPENNMPIHNPTPSTAGNRWPSSQQMQLRDPDAHTGINFDARMT